MDDVPLRRAPGGQPGRACRPGLSLRTRGRRRSAQRRRRPSSRCLGRGSRRDPAFNAVQDILEELRLDALLRVTDLSSQGGRERAVVQQQMIQAIDEHFGVAQRRAAAVAAVDPSAKISRHEAIERLADRLDVQVALGSEMPEDRGLRNACAFGDLPGGNALVSALVEQLPTLPPGPGIALSPNYAGSQRQPKPPPVNDGRGRPRRAAPGPVRPPSFATHTGLSPRRTTSCYRWIPTVV
jgi:hypothetical protein